MEELQWGDTRIQLARWISIFRYKGWNSLLGIENGWSCLGETEETLDGITVTGTGIESKRCIVESQKGEPDVELEESVGK